MNSAIGKSKELQDKYVYCGMSMAVRYRTEGKQKLAKRSMSQVAPTTHGQQVWSKVEKWRCQKKRRINKWVAPLERARIHEVKTFTTTC